MVTTKPKLVTLSVSEEGGIHYISIPLKGGNLVRQTLRQRSLWLDGPTAVMAVASFLCLRHDFSRLEGEAYLVGPISSILTNSSDSGDVKRPRLSMALCDDTIVECSERGSRVLIPLSAFMRSVVDSIMRSGRANFQIRSLYPEPDALLEAYNDLRRLWSSRY